MFAVVAAAAKIDPEVVDRADITEQRRRAGARSVMDSLRSAGTLRPGLTPQRAIDVLWLLNSPAVFAHLVRRAGWSLDQYPGVARRRHGQRATRPRPTARLAPTASPDASDPTLWLTVETHASTPRTERLGAHSQSRSDVLSDI